MTDKNSMETTGGSDLVAAAETVGTNSFREFVNTETTLADLAEVNENMGPGSGINPVSDTFIIVISSGSEGSASSEVGWGDEPGEVFTSARDPERGDTTTTLEERVEQLEAAVAASRETEPIEERVHRLERILG